ncbi:CAZyme family GH1 [Aspergillus niger]|nr:CAZyme family GH1 [Aspergillus niger]KAI3017979.1 CAZyme family GH1 [Aspergillus niger]KAI3035146.1 CAZyme family GH1 [Aspergillus niger]KAI3059655.1 CAZyme family GH1 [Aspergillus niger]
MVNFNRLLGCGLWSLAITTAHYAQSAHKPTVVPAYGRPYSEVSGLLPNLKTTTWGNFEPGTTATATQRANDDDPFGEAEWTSSWLVASLLNYTTIGMYTTTVAATPVPSSELVLPPPLPFSRKDCYEFPEEFMFGVAISASQHEGAIALEGRTPTISETVMRGGTSGATNYVANEHYYLYKQDIERMAAIGAEYFSFSISWSRILPFIFPDTPVNQRGVDHYDDVINTAINAGLKPVVTLLHFDTPYAFIRDSVDLDFQIGGWRGGYDNMTFPNAYLHYAKLAISLYGDRVSHWITFNEPMAHTNNAQGVRNVIKCHAEVWHWYHKTYQGKGMIGMKQFDYFSAPLDPSNASHVQAANNFNDFWTGTIYRPLCLGEDYPSIYKRSIANVTFFTKEELKHIGGSIDFIGLDMYAGVIAFPQPGNFTPSPKLKCTPMSGACIGVDLANLTNAGWTVGYGSVAGGNTFSTGFFRAFFNYIDRTYKKPFILTEFGFSNTGDSGKSLDDARFDVPSSLFITNVLTEMLESIWEDGCDIIGAFVWTLIDDWE